MTGEPNDPGDGRNAGWWTALAGAVAFVAIGLTLVPGLVRHEAAAPEPRTPEPPLREALATGIPPAPLEDPLAATSRAARPAAESRAFDCMIGPSEVIDIGSSITGVIDRILVERSEYVEAGEVLAQLEASVERAAVRVARARAERTVDIDSSAASYDLGEKRRSRALELFDSKALSLDQRQEVEAEATLAALELERAREDHRLASLQLEQAAAALERRTIRSPVAGFVVERMMAPGEVVDEQTILRIAQVHPLRIEAILPSDWFGRVRPGDQAEIVPETPLDQPRAAQVALVDPVIDGASGTFGVHLLLPNSDHELPAGLRCKLRFASGETSGDEGQAAPVVEAREATR
jgi:RND family efflux transporter MFP subunit